MRRKAKPSEKLNLPAHRSFLVTCECSCLRTWVGTCRGTTTRVCHPACHPGLKGINPFCCPELWWLLWHRYSPKWEDLGMKSWQYTKTAYLLLWDRVSLGSTGRYKGAGVLECCLGSQRMEESSLPLCKIWLFNALSFPTSVSNQMFHQLPTSKSSLCS